MRLSADLFRWGIATLLMVPFLGIPGLLMGLSPLLWLALAAIVVGGALNAAAVVRGVRRVADGRVVDDLLSSVDARDAAATPSPSVEPRQRLIFPDGDERSPGTVDTSGSRRRTGVIAAVALVALTTFGAWTLAIEQPLAIAQGQLTLEETYAAWNAVSQTGFVIAMTVWGLLALALSAAVFVAARITGPVGQWLGNGRRLIALAAIVGSVIVTAAFAPYFAVGLSLPDDLPFVAGGVASPLSTAFGVTGVLLSCLAIALTVPRWGWRSRA